MLEQVKIKYGFLISISVLILYCLFYDANNDPFHIVSIFTSFLIVFFAAVSVESTQNKLLLLIGDASYSIYLVHGFVTMLLGSIMKKFNLVDLNQVVTILATVSISLLLGIASYYLIEKNIGLIFKSKKEKHSTVQHVKNIFSDGK
jgi:exopolysaccharide production protein ExoZ